VKLCSFEGCDRKHAANGLCDGHRGQAYDGKALTQLREKLPNGAHKTCTFDGCDRSNLARGLCSTHYAQFKAGNDLTPIGMAWDIKAQPDKKLAELFSRTNKNGECLEYMANGIVKKYATVGWKGGSEGVHRIVYALHYGEDISGAQIHHSCANSACINPEHLQRASAANNTLDMLARKDYEAEIARLRLRIVELEAKLEMESSCA
jgi:hypothetical protein